MNENVQFITSAGLVSIMAEYKRLKDEVIPDIASRIDEAKQQGDLSENAEYHHAKDEMAWTRGRLLELQNILDHAQVVEELQKTDGVIGVGSKVTVKGKGAEKTYTIVGPQEANPPYGKISNESPLGQAFLGRRAGETLEVKVPSGVQIYEIIDVS